MTTRLECHTCAALHVRLYQDKTLKSLKNRLTKVAVDRGMTKNQTVISYLRGWHHRGHRPAFGQHQEYLNGDDQRLGEAGQVPRQ